MKPTFGDTRVAVFTYTDDPAEYEDLATCPTRIDASFETMRQAKNYIKREVLTYPAWAEAQVYEADPYHGDDWVYDESR